MDEAGLLGAPALVLLISLVIGITFFCLEKRRGQVVTADLFFTGNRQLHTLPMSASLVATLLTPLSWLTLPTVVARHGVTPALAASAGLVLATPIAAMVFLPVFFNMQPTTAFEYLEQRFSTAIKLLASGLFVCHTLTTLPALLYVPFAALQEVTDMPMLYAGPIVLVFALAYTALGGMRALQWAALGHVILASFTLVTVLVLGSSLQTTGDVWSLLLAKHTHLLVITADGWSAGLGAAFWAGSLLAAGQQQVQRYLSVPLLSQSTVAMVVAVVGVLLLGVMLVVAGLLMAVHEALPNSDLAGDEHSMEHYLSFTKFCLKVVSSIPALNGLIVASITCIVLSALAGGVHALAAVLTVDVWGVRSKTREMPVSRARWVMALSSVLVLVASTLMVLWPEPLLSVALMFPRVTGGALLGLFCLGMLIPWANTTGAMIGAVFSLVAVWMASMGSSLIINFTSVTSNTTLSALPLPQSDGSVSSIAWTLPAAWLNPLGCTVTLLVGALVSALACPKDPRTLDPDLVAPCIRWIHSRIWSWDIGENFQDSSSVKEDFEYEAVATSHQDVAVAPARGARTPPRYVQRRRQAPQEAWPDIAYPHLSRRNRAPPASSSRPRSGLAWDHVSGTLYLSEQ